MLMKTRKLKLSRGCQLLALVLAGSLTFLFLSDATAAESYAFVKMWPEKKEEWGSSRQDAALHCSGNFFISHRYAHSVKRLDRSANPLSRWRAPTNPFRMRQKRRAYGDRGNLDTR